MNLNDYPYEQKQISWKPVAIIAGGVLIAVFLVIGAFRLINGKNETVLQTKQVENQRAAIEQTCESAINKEECVQQQTQKLASQTGNVLFCDGLTDKSYDACVWELGVDKKETAICENIINEEWKRLCSDSVNYSLAVDARKEANLKQDSRVCDKLADVEKAEYCKEELLLVDDPDFDDLDDIQEKLYGTDPYKADTDGDGYSDSQEIAAGYNPNGSGKLE